MNLIEILGVALVLGLISVGVAEHIKKSKNHNHPHLHNEYEKPRCIYNSRHEICKYKKVTCIESMYSHGKGISCFKNEGENK